MAGALFAFHQSEIKKKKFNFPPRRVHCSSDVDTQNGLLGFRNLLQQVTLGPDMDLFLSAKIMRNSACPQQWVFLFLQGMFVEMWLTFILVQTIWGATNKKRRRVLMPGLPIGLAVALDIITGVGTGGWVRRAGGTGEDAGEWAWIWIGWVWGEDWGSGGRVAENRG